LDMLLPKQRLMMGHLCSSLEHSDISGNYLLVDM
jgi:hypothetical protein